MGGCSVPVMRRPPSTVCIPIAAVLALAGCKAGKVAAVATTTPTQSATTSLRSPSATATVPTEQPAGEMTGSLSGDQKIACDAAAIGDSLPALEVAYLGNLALNLNPGDEALAVAKDGVKSAIFSAGLADYLCGLAKTGTWSTGKVRRADYCKLLKQAGSDRLSVTSSTIERALQQSRLIPEEAIEEARDAVKQYSDAVSQLEVSLTILTCGL